MAETIAIAGAVLAGGQSRRFGSDKALAEVGEELMGGHVAAAIRGAGIDPVVVIGGSAEMAAKLALVQIADQFPGEGPLGATATALNYFTGSHVVVAACDLPLLQSETVLQLISGLAPGEGAVAAIDGQAQLSLGCWPTSHYRQVLAAIRDGQRRWSILIDLIPHRLVQIDGAAMNDADDPETLAELLDSTDP